MIELTCRLDRGGFRLDVETRLERAATGVFGRSGSGKSSLLLALAGLLPVEELRLVVGGEVVVDSGAGHLPPAHRRRVGLVFQDHRLFPHMTVAANLRDGRGGAGDGPSEQEVVELLDIGGLLTRRPFQCSGGERQRVALGRALLGAPRLLLLDEPLASLDRGLKRQVLPYLRRVRERYGLPLMIVSHDLGELLALTDELLLVDGGQVVGQGALTELTSHADALELLHDCGLVFALPGRVERRDEDGLTWVRVEGRDSSLIACGDCQDSLGERVEVQLRPEDVVLALPPMESQLSLNNCLRGRVVGVTRSSARVIVEVDCGLAAPLLAEVTERAVRRLGLKAGVEVEALFKAQATRTKGFAAG